MSPKIKLETTNVNLDTLKVNDSPQSKRSKTRKNSK